jgi:hypothetical protein
MFSRDTLGKKVSDPSTWDHPTKKSRVGIQYLTVSTCIVVEDRGNILLIAFAIDLSTLVIVFK